MMKTSSWYRSKLPRKQTGASLFAIIVVMTLLALIILSGLKISPAYMDDAVIGNTINNLVETEEIEGMSLREIRTYVARTMQANRISFSNDYLEEVEENGVDYIQVRYESRVALFSNIDAVVKFDYLVEIE
ncbi:MAG: DUF4845 domain-containing protein [Gammaproteobacteria bacterium]|nr:DUF4845 domain-containing protein [Gammaproteobacteria bacterium]